MTVCTRSAAPLHQLRHQTSGAMLHNFTGLLLAGSEKKKNNLAIPPPSRHASVIKARHKCFKVNTGRGVAMATKSPRGLGCVSNFFRFSFWRDEKIHMAETCQRQAFYDFKARRGSAGAPRPFVERQRVAFPEPRWHSQLGSQTLATAAAAVRK